MKFISHRGNLSGSDPGLENTEDAIQIAIECGFDVEIDVRIIDGKIFLGHDNPDHETSIEFLTNYRKELWIHAKNINALVTFLDLKFNVFYHTDEAYVLTSHNVIWAFPGNELGSFKKSRMISVLPHNELAFQEIESCWGICTDFPRLWKAKMKRYKDPLSYPHE